MGPESGWKRLWSQIGGMRRTWEGSNPKRRNCHGGSNAHSMCKDEEKGSKIGKKTTDEYEMSEMVHEHAKKEVLLLGRDFYLNDAAFSGDNSETERKKI